MLLTTFKAFFFQIHNNANFFSPYMLPFLLLIILTIDVYCTHTYTTKYPIQSQYTLQ
eukprot:UN10192